MNSFIYGALVLLILMFVSRNINNKAALALTAEQKAKLVDLFAQNRTTSFIVLLVIIAGFFAVSQLELLDNMVAFVLYVSALFVYVFVAGYQSYQKLVAHDFPADYRKSFLIAAAVRAAGMAIFFAFILY